MRLKEQINQELKELYPDEEVLQDILKRKISGRIPGFRLLLCAAFLGCVLVIPVSAHMLGNILETTRITDANRSLLEEPDIAVSETLPAGMESLESPVLLMDDLEKVSEVTDGIVLEIENGAFLPDTISIIRLSSDKSRLSWTIPELLTANGFTTIFTKEDGAGWYLQKGETLNLCYRIGRTAGTDQSDPAERMEIGYIEDHIFRQGEVFVETDFSYTLTAPETGIYYLYCINCSAGKIYIEEGNIE